MGSSPRLLRFQGSARRAGPSPFLEWVRARERARSASSPPPRHRAPENSAEAAAPRRRGSGRAAPRPRKRRRIRASVASAGTPVSALDFAPPSLSGPISRVLAGIFGAAVLAIALLSLRSGAPNLAAISLRSRARHPSSERNPGSGSQRPLGGLMAARVAL